MTTGWERRVKGYGIRDIDVAVVKQRDCTGKADEALVVW